MINKSYALLEKIRNKQSGFSLVELLMYMGLSMIILIIITGLFASVINIRGEAEKTSSVERDGRYMISRLTYDINRAQEIIEPALLGDSSTTLQLVIDGQTVTYQIINNKLSFTDSTGTYAINNKDVNMTIFNVTRLGNEGGKNGIQAETQIVSQNESEGKIESREYNFFAATR
ncbi:MAG: prepilin-type N-terminal cleavage/methylation domain-containing protein [Candidatus Pacebacteria bacterium]|nr:prepilin-type N-terminal cleavage/methylation domain-containing protein [Candidatus Paceibacterota bacterium]